MHRIKTQTIWICLLIIVSNTLLIGCSSTSHNPIATPKIQPTVTLFPTITQIFTTPIGTPTLVPTFTPSTTPTQLPPRIPLPTLSSEEDILKFISFTGNSDCKLPCLAGIIPNQTNWDEAVFALQPMKSVAKLEILTDEESIYGKVNAISWYLSSDEFRIDGNFLIRSSISLIRMNFESFSDTTPSYSLPLPKLYNMQSVLKEYGSPSMVFIYTFIHDEQGPLPFSVLLVYPEDQFYILYQRDAKLSGNNVVACDSEYYVELTVVDSVDKLISYDAIANTPEMESIGIENWMPVEQVLNVSSEKFYELYSTSSPGCISFPTKNWLP